MKEQQIYKITKFYSKKEFKKIKKNLEKKELKPIILGNINLNNKHDKEKEKEDKKDLVYLKEKENKKDKYFYILDDEKLSNVNVSKFGYVGNEEFIPLFIQIKRSPIIFFIWFLFLLIGILSILLFMPCPNKENRIPLDFANGQALNGEGIQNGKITQPDAGAIEIPCYFNLYLKTNEPLKLINPKGNDVYFVYTIYENGEQIYKTKAIAPDTMILSRLPHILPVGEHNLVFEISTYDIKDQTPCNGAVLDVKLTNEAIPVEETMHYLDTDEEKLEYKAKYYKYILDELNSRDDLTTLEIAEKENLEKFFNNYEEFKDMTGKEYFEYILKENEEKKAKLEKGA